MMLAALAPKLVGPILLAGSPISYWAGVAGKNPMRYSGGLLGGTWMASLAGDLGHGKFDGAYLVNNFENLNPSNTYWTKLYNLYAKVDTERERFLEFEKWWGGHYLMNKEEMEWISQNLFVGNKLSAGEVESFDGKHRVDIRNIRSPIVVFASWGDNITPPQQALDWIPDLYRSVEEIRLNEQTIVYCLHEKIGHLGIFVSASIAKRETAELASALELIDTLPPGLYEAIITDTHPEMPGLEYTDGRYLIQFVPRTTDDILALDDGRKDEQAFEVVNRVSQINQGLYDTFASPIVKAMSNEATARVLRETNPARLERWFFSDMNPWMLWVKSMAETVRANRRPVAPDNPFVKVERDVSGQIEQALDQYRDVRDEMSERMFKAIYESPWLAAAVGADADSLGRRGPQSATWEQDELKRLKRQEFEAGIEQGTLLDAWARLLIYVRPEGSRGRRAALQHGPAHDRGAEARERAVARGAEGRGEAPGVHPRARRGARDRGAAEARARDAPPPTGLRRRPDGDEIARRADAPSGGALPPGCRHSRARHPRTGAQIRMSPPGRPKGESRACNARGIQ